MTARELALAIAQLPRPLLVALDVDGTLAPIVEDPEQARVPSATTSLLRGLAQVDGVVLALVTGRDVAQLARMVDLPLAWRAVEHGSRVLAPGERVAAREPLAVRARLAPFLAWARSEALPRGARIEAKASSIGVHVRELRARDPAAASLVLERAREQCLRLGLHPREGRAVLEAQLESADKGSALRGLLERTGAKSCVYAGDDLTDEPAIRAASRFGLGIFVRSEERDTPFEGASAVVEGPAGLAAVLAELDRCLRVST